MWRKKRKRIRERLTGINSKNDLWYIVRSTGDPWRNHAIIGLIQHRDLTCQDAWQLLDIVQKKSHVQDLLQFLWDLDKDYLLDVIKSHGSEDVREAAWIFFKKIASRISENLLKTYLPRLVDEDPDHRQSAWDLLLSLNPSRTCLGEILRKENPALGQIKREAVNLLNKMDLEPKSPSKDALAIVKVANSPRPHCRKRKKR